jgi:hypothetical protein
MYRKQPNTKAYGRKMIISHPIRVYGLRDDIFSYVPELSENRDKIAIYKYIIYVNVSQYNNDIGTTFTVALY